MPADPERFEVPTKPREIGGFPTTTSTSPSDYMRDRSPVQVLHQHQTPTADLA